MKLYHYNSLLKKIQYEFVQYISEQKTKNSILDSSAYKLSSYFGKMIKLSHVTSTLRMNLPGTFALLQYLLYSLYIV